MLGRMLLPLIALFAWAPLLAHAQIADPSSYVRQIHQQYVGREPTAYELQYWIDQINRGMSPREVQAFIISSEAYFDRNQRNADVWIMSTLTQVCRRAPTSDESRYWTERYRVLNQNRLVWAKELVRWANSGSSGSSSGSSGSSAGGAAAGGGQATASDDLPGRLVSTAQLLSQAVSTEVTGNSRWLIQLQANSLLTTATTSRDLLSKAGGSATDASAAIEYLEQSLQSVHTSLNQLGYTTPSSQHYVMQAGDILTALKKMYPGAGPAPLQLPSPPPTLAPVTRDALRPIAPSAPLTPVTPASLQTSADPSAYPAVPPTGDSARSSADLQQACRQLVLLVRSRNSREPTYDRLLRDVESMSASVGLFRNNLQYGYAPEEQRRHVQELQRQTTTIDRDLQAVSFDTQLTQLWHDTTLALNVLAADVGLSADPRGSPAQYAVPVRRPAFSGLPYNLPSPTAAASVSSEAMQALDQAISQCDALTSTLGLYGYYTPGVAQLINELRAERNVLTDLRRQATQVPVPPLRSALQAVNDQYRRVTSSWDNVTRAGSRQPLPSLQDLNAALDRVNQSLSWLP